MVEVEAAQKVLVRLPRAAVLRDDHAGHELEHVGRPQRRPRLDLALADAALGRRGRRAEQLARRGGDDDLGRDHFQAGDVVPVWARQAQACDNAVLKKK